MKTPKQQNILNTAGSPYSVVSYDTRLANEAG